MNRPFVPDLLAGRAAIPLDVEPIEGPQYESRRVGEVVVVGEPEIGEAIEHGV